ncbi:MAG: uroporphyrinogen-III C-methyltransferase [Caldilineaceae bacterium]
MPLNLMPHAPTLRVTTGKAYLIGAGPGYADLITVRGLRLLQRAQVVIYDRLIDDALLDEVPTDAERIYVGKGPGFCLASQDEINAILVDRVRAGKQVVRLKGGDPFVFGRGGEEALALREAGLPYEIVPGVSSALAVPAFAGVPVTHRGIATSFAVVTGHEAHNKSDETFSQTNWEALAAIPTLVVLMGLGNLPEIALHLLAAGRAGDTPAIAIQRGATADQKIVSATLTTIASKVQAAQLTSPAVIVIGEVAALHHQLAWVEQQPEQAETFYLAMPLSFPSSALVMDGDQPS